MTDEGKLLLIRGRRNKILLGLAGVAFLVAGVAVAPRADHTKPTGVVPDEPVAPLLAPAPPDPPAAFAGLLETGVEARRSVVRVSRPRDRVSSRARPDRPVAEPEPLQAPGIVIAPGKVLTHADVLGQDAAGDALSVQSEWGQGAATVERCDPATGLVLLATSETVAPATVAAAPAALEGNTLGIAVSRISIDPVVVSPAGGDSLRLTLTRPSPGTPVFDAHGGWLGVARSGTTAWTPAGARHALERLAHAVPRTLGLTLQPITEDLAPLVDGPGLLIADTGPFATGLLPGDVIRRVGGLDVASTADYDRALEEMAPGSLVTMAVSRSRRPLTLEVPVYGSCTAHPPPAPRPGVSAGTLFPEGALERAGLPPAAIVLEVGGRGPSTGRPPRRRGAELVRAQAPGQPPAFYAVGP